MSNEKELTIKEFNTLMCDKENEILRLKNQLYDCEQEKDKLIFVIVELAKRNIQLRARIK